MRAGASIERARTPFPISGTPPAPETLNKGTRIYGFTTSRFLNGYESYYRNECRVFRFSYEFGAWFRLACFGMPSRQAVRPSRFCSAAQQNIGSDFAYAFGGAARLHDQWDRPIAESVQQRCHARKNLCRSTCPAPLLHYRAGEFSFLPLRQRVPISAKCLKKRSGAAL